MPLTILFQLSLNQGIIPTDWKQATVVPIFKGKGDKNEVNNYRPVSLTSTTCKVMESIIHKHITEYCDKNKILTHEQHGFRSKHSTTSNLLELINEITSLMDIGHSVDVITVDFAKAFDSISHNKLLYKLKMYGICGKIHTWIKEFLINRFFNVKIKATLSKNYPVISSTPQGSKLAPLLYILYANDISKMFKYIKIKMYADDVTIYAIADNPNVHKLIQNDLNNLIHWADIWQLKINFDKCHVIHFGHKNSNFEYYFDMHKIGVSKCEKNLGVWLDDKLSFKEHVYEIVNKSSRVCALILNNIKNVDNNMLIKLYKCFVRPVLEYASVVFSSHHISLIDLIENVQRRFTKRLYGMHNICYVDRLKLCNLELLELRCIKF